MAEKAEKAETRNIRLLPERPLGSYGIGTTSLEAEPGEVYKVLRDDARLLVAGGHFEYVELPETDDFDLPENFPQRALLIKNELDSLQKIREASDETILKINGIGDKYLAEIRTAAEKAAGGEEDNAAQ